MKKDITPYTTSKNAKEELNAIYETIKTIKKEKDILKKHLIHQIISYKLLLDDTITDEEIAKYYSSPAEQLIMLYHQLQFNSNCKSETNKSAYYRKF